MILKKRENYFEEIATMAVEDLIFLDESGAHLQMAPIYGRGYGHERIHYPVPFNRGNKLTLISAISIHQVEAALYGEWSANGEIFLNFIERCLCPVLSPGKVVVMDNVSFHQVHGIREAIEARGAYLLYLPAYSPDLNPIEQMWSKIKSCLRKFCARTLDAFSKAIKIAFESIHKTDLNHWYNHCGYTGSIF